MISPAQWQSQRFSGPSGVLGRTWGQEHELFLSFEGLCPAMWLVGLSQEADDPMGRGE
jgi:hypothetical protein